MHLCSFISHYCKLFFKKSACSLKVYKIIPNKCLQWQEICAIMRVSYIGILFSEHLPSRAEGRTLQIGKAKSAKGVNFLRVSRYSEKEEAILSFVNTAIKTDGYSPTVRDIQTALGIKSTSTVHAYLRRLEEKGLISKAEGKSRTLHIDDDTDPQAERPRTARVPLLGHVRAGMPIMAVENFEGYIDYPLMNRSYPANELFALRIKGESMINAGILDGDIIVVRKTATASNGDIVVALTDEGTTVKTFYKEHGHFRLQPENDEMEPIITSEVMILGSVIANFRFYK